MLSIDMLTMFSPLSSVRSALYACISTLCGALSCLRGAPSVQGSIHGLCIHFYYSRCYSVMFRPIMLVPMFRLVPGYPLVLPRSRYVPECITRSVLCSGVVRPRYLGRERRLVVLIVWGLTLCRRRSRFVVVPCSNAYIVWGLTLCRRRSRRRLIPHLTGYEPWALPGLKSNDLPPSVAHRRLATRHRTPCYTHYTIVPR